MDNTGGCVLYLSKDSLGTSITTAKSSEINVLVPGGASDGDWVWFRVPSSAHDLDFLVSVDRILTQFYSLFFEEYIRFKKERKLFTFAF